MSLRHVGRRAVGWGWMLGRLFVLPLAAQPGPRASHDAEVLSRWRPAAPQHCTLLPYPKALPAADVLVDSATVMTAAARASGYALFTLKFGVDGSTQRKALIESDLPSSARRALTRVVMQSVRRQPARPIWWSVRVRVRGGRAPALEVGRSEVCPPAPRPRTDAPAGSGRVEIYDPRVHRTDVPTAAFLVSVDQFGAPVETILYRSSGDAQLDSRLGQLAASYRFLPALDDRVPVAGDDTLRLSLVAP